MIRKDFVILLMCLTAYGLLRGSEELEYKYRKWLDEDVTYIITAKEKEVFLQLENDRERELFIEAFWRHRDPTPLDDRNEFKEEHYRRIEYANRQFGRASSLPGWKTDQGRIYIILGPPTSFHVFDSFSSLYPSVIWSYMGMSKYRLPDAFNIVFYKRRGTGDYRLYSPSMDGPESLVAHISSGGMDARAAYQEIFNETPVLAQASISLLPGEPGSVDHPSLSSVRLLQDVHEAPQNIINDEYSEKFILYKDIVEVEYSINYIGNESTSHIIKDKNGMHFVHYLVVLDKFSVNQYDNKYMTRLLINGTVTDSDGKNVFQYERSLPIKFEQGQFEKIKVQKFSFQDVFPMIEGDYRFSLLVKNEASKEFSSFEKEISVPGDYGLGISELILSYKKESEQNDLRKKSYKVGSTLLYPTPQNGFSPQDHIILCFQLYGLSQRLYETSALNIAVFKDGEKILDEVKKLSEYDSSETYIEEIPLKEVTPSYYKLKVAVLDENRQQLLAREALFSVSAVQSLPRPWINSIVHASSEKPVYLLIIGEQYLKKREFSKAKKFLGEAFRKNPNDPSFGLSYCRVLFELNEYDEVIQVLSRFHVIENSEALEIMGRSHHALGRYDQAIEYYRNYLTHYGITFSMLSLLGDCYYQKGNIAEALKYWNKSLDLNPKQEDLRKLMESIKK